MNIKDFPKIQSPFKREEINGAYVCVPKFREEFKWILDPNVVIATEKFDGTNTSCVVKDGGVKSIFNRTNRIDIWKSSQWFYTGVRRSIDEKKFKPQMSDDGQYFGELIGPKIQGNKYELDKALWIPFNYIKEHYNFRFYLEWLKEQDFSTDENIYNAFSELFKNLKSLYFRKRGIERQPEGIVFHNKETGEMCKLRVDMWDWYLGNRHKDVE